MNNLKKGLFTLLVALFGGFFALWAYTRYFDDPKIVSLSIEYNNYSYSRIYVPKYLSNASKILFAVRKEK